ncbi:GNAT family N-acetyltransferase [Nocardioides sp.]|uniref:GNAT family N-acetyltransferase n=1 Tax=Nocardioides sp. TaxID=35761 RepID=UPI003528DEB1
MITTMTRAHLAPCVSLYIETFSAPPWNESWRADDAAQRLGEFLTTPRAVGLCLLDDGGRLLRFALGHLERFGAEDHFLLKEMCVRLSEQRRGHGTRILQALAERLGEVQHWYLLTARDGSAAAFYARNGFRSAGRMGVFVRP